VRAPFGERQRSRRAAGRRRIASRIRQPLTAEQQAFDPLTRGKRPVGRRLAGALLAIVASLGAHAAVVGLGVALRANLGQTRHEEVVIEMRQPPPPPPPEQKAPPPEPPPPVEKPTRPPPKVAKAPPPPATPAPPPKAPPVRVVGLSLESTTEGGGGPSFAAGNTRLGETEKHAIDPKDVTPPPSGVSTLPAAGTGRTNQIASRIPVDGITYVKAKRKVDRPAVFPPTLKSQGIEGQVSVMVSVNAAGKVTKVKIIKESPYPEFNEAARVKVLADEYEPETRNGVPMATTLVFDVRFRLEDE
jgi:periplasmic protein TonB